MNSWAAAMRYQLDYPLTWPAGQPRTRNPQQSRFRNVEGYRPDIRKARAAVIRELELLGADRVSISTNSATRRDGDWSEARQVMTDKGAAVYWNFGDERKVLACDKWETLGENLWAIAKTIEATRGIERWGSVTTKQAFAGYTALPEKTQASCWEVLGVNKDGFNLANPAGKKHAEQIIISAWREKMRATHPDHGGNAEDFSAVNAAKDMALQLINQ